MGGMAGPLSLISAIIDSVVRIIDAMLAAFSTAARTGYYIPITRDGLDLTGSLDCRTVFEVLGPVLEDSQLRIIGHDLKRQMVWLAEHGVRLGGLEFDTKVAGYLLDATRATPTLDSVALEHTGYQVVSTETVRGNRDSHMCIEIWSTRCCRCSLISNAQESVLPLMPLQSNPPVCKPS